MLGGYSRVCMYSDALINVETVAKKIISGHDALINETFPPPPALLSVK